MTCNPRLSDEIWLATKIKAAGGQTPLGGGLTTPKQRAERCRQAILSANLQDAIVGKKDGELWTFAKAFAWLYAEPLT